MVNIIINEVKNDPKEEMSIVSEDVKIQEDYGEELKSLSESYNSLKDEYVTLRDGFDESLKVQKRVIRTVSDLIEHIEYLTKVVHSFEDKHISSSNSKPIKNTKEVKNKTKTKKKSKSNKIKTVKKSSRSKGNDTFQPTEYSRKHWDNLILLDDYRIKENSRRGFILPVDLNDLLYLIECDTPKMTYNDYKELMVKYDSNPNTFGKIIYNIREGKFSNVLKTYRDCLKNTKFSIHPVNDTIRINKVNTTVRKEQAREWIDIIINSSNKEEKIMNLQMENKNIPKMYVRTICDSYNNKDLLECVKAEPSEPFVENNPSRRRNLLRQGGLI